MRDTNGQDLRLWFELNALPMWVFDRVTLAFLDVNPAAIAQYGYSREEFLRMTIADIRPPEDVPALLKTVSGEPPRDSRIWRHRRKDGSEVSVQVFSVPLGTGPNPPMLIAANDVTRFTDALEELEAQRAFLRNVIDTSPDFVFAKDREGRFTLVNRAVAEAYGTTVEELVGKRDADFNKNADEVEHFRHDDLSVLESGRDLLIPEEKITDALGRVRWLQTVKRRLNAPGASAPHVLGIATDISERKKLEQQLFQSQKMEAVGRLAGGVAHDFNNLLTVILGYSNLLALQIEETHPMREAVLEIQRAGESAARLTRHLLAFSRRQVLQPTVLVLNDVVNETRRMLERILTENIRLELRLATDLWKAKVDQGQLEQVILNLVVNAGDAMPSGGALTIETANIRFEDDSSIRYLDLSPGEYVMLAVHDTGTGMSAETLSHAFEPFFTTKEAGKGTGIGLSTVFGIVKQSGGNVWIYSELGRGTSVKAYLPRALGENAPERISAAGPALPLGSGVVLLVEDSDMVRKLARVALTEGGYEILEAANGEEALGIAAARDGRIDLLLTDYVMPDMNGRELADRLWAGRSQSATILMSGYTDDAIIRDGALGPRMHFLQKPFTPRALLRKVREVLTS